jgi:hypothetical protein
LKLTIYAAILNAILVLLSIFALPLTIFIGGFLVSVATSLVLGGYFLRYFLDVLYNSVGKVDQPPDVPGFKLKELFVTGLKGWGILVVYILPIVTLPLLPLGLLALAVTDDGRAYNLRWAFVQAWRSRNPLTVLWGMMILWTLLAAALAVVVYLSFHFAMAYFETADIAGGFIQFGLAILRGMGLVAVGGLWMTAIFRCAGIMGRHFPAIVESLPEKENPFASLGWLFAGVMLSLASLQWAIAPALKALASLPP